MKALLRWFGKILGTVITVSLLIVLTPYLSFIVADYLPDIKGERIQVTATLSRHLKDASDLVTKTTEEQGEILEKKMMSKDEVAASVYIEYTYTAAFGIDLSQTNMQINDNKIIFTLPSPKLIQHELHRDNTETSSVANTWIAFSENEIQEVADKRKNDCCTAYLVKGSTLNQEIRDATIRSFENTIASWLKNDEINPLFTFEYRWADDTQ